MSSARPVGFQSWTPSEVSLVSESDRKPCPKCGALNYPTDAVCLGCGAELAPPQPREEPPSRRIGWRKRVGWLKPVRSRPAARLVALAALALSVLLLPGLHALVPSRYGLLVDILVWVTIGLIGVGSAIVAIHKGDTVRGTASLVVELLLLAALLAGSLLIAMLALSSRF